MKKKHLVKNLILIPFLSFLLFGCSNVSNTYTFHLTYDYGTITQRENPETGEHTPIITSLWDGGFLDMDFDDDTREHDFLVPGDTLTIEYTGELLAQESYPARWVIEDGEVTNVEYSWTTIVEIPSENIVKENDRITSISNYSYPDNYVVLDKEMNYIALDEYEGNLLFGSYDSSRETNCPEGCLCEPQPYPLGTLFAFNPRA